MKVADMYRGMEVAVRRNGYESWHNYQKGTIVALSSGGGHAQQHRIRFDDGTEQGIHARRIMEPWSSYWQKHGEDMEARKQQKEKAALHHKLKEQYKEIQQGQAERVTALLLVLGIEATSMTNTRWDPANEDAFAFSLIINHLDKLEQLLEPMVQTRLTSMFNPESKPLDTDSSAE